MLIIVRIFSLKMLDMFVMFLLCNCSFIVFSYLGIWSRMKLRMRDVAFEMPLRFYIWGSWMRQPLFASSKTVFIKFIHVKRKQKYISFHSCYSRSSSHLPTKHMGFTGMFCVSVSSWHTYWIKMSSYIIARSQCFRHTHYHTPKYL